ncbi:MAG: lipoyl(octanoyl) transferase LipB [Clostridia bacterium]|nr:lipoyl(octanoyl) transferase LipB [Clostridia bacterium]
MEPILVTVLPGLIDYQEGLNLQRALLSLRQQNKIGDILLLLEHPPVLTLGKHADENHILFPAETLEAQGIKVYETDRGGDVTYHGPGQVVGYPIIHLQENRLSVRQYVWLLEQLFIDLLDKEYSLEAYRDPDYPGVWFDKQKITAIGCAIKKRVTIHGFAFNVNTNLEHFKVINPCGIIDRGVISLQSIFGYPLKMDLVKKLIIEYFCRSFEKKPEIFTWQELQKMMEDGPVVD